MNFKSTNFKTALLGVVLVWTFFVPVFVSAKVLSPSMKGRSFNPNSDSASVNYGSRGETPILIPDQSSEVLKAHSVTPEMLHQMQELQNEGGQQEGNSNSSEQFSWQSGLLTGFVSSIFHKVSTFAKNNFRKIILPIASAVGATYALMSTYGTRLIRKVKTVTSKVVRGLEQLGNETIKLAKPVVKFTKDVVGPIKEFASTYGAEAGTMGAIGAGLFAFATLKPIRQWGVKQIAKGLKKLDSYSESFDSGSRTSLGMYGKGLAVGAGLTVVGLVSGLAMVAIEPELVQDAAGHAIVSTYNIATHPSKLVADVKQVKNSFLNWSDNTSMYEKGIAVSKFSINSALALDGAQAVIAKAAALKTGTIAEEAAVATEEGGTIAKTVNSTVFTENQSDAVTRAVQHSVEKNHYPGLTSEEIAQKARTVITNPDVKVRVYGLNKKTYYFNSKTGDLFINNPSQPTMFVPKDGSIYITRKVSQDLLRGNWLK